MKSLTISQRDALLTIKVVHDLFVKRFHDDKLADLFPGENVTPSEWSLVATLEQTHKIHYRIIDALVKKGFLEKRSTDGFGPEVRLVKKSQ